MHGVGYVINMVRSYKITWYTQVKEEESHTLKNVRIGRNPEETEETETVCGKEDMIRVNVIERILHDHKAGDTQKLSMEK